MKKEINNMEVLYNSSNPLVRFIHTQRINTIKNRILPIKEKILDAGGGEGHLTELLYKNFPNNQFHIIDNDLKFVKKARKRCPYAIIRKGNLLNTKYANGFFDIIILTEVIEHIKNYKQVIKELKRILKPNGILIITFPNELLWTLSRALLLRKPIKLPEHINSFTPRLMKKIVKLPCTKQINLPFRLPFIFSLNSILTFIKIEGGQ